MPVAASMLLVVGWTALATSTPLSSMSIAAAADNELTITSQLFNLPADGTFTVTIELPQSVDGAALGTDAVVTVTSFARLINRDVFLQSVQGDLECVDDTGDDNAGDNDTDNDTGDGMGCIDDEFEISLDPADADSNVTRPSVDTLALTVPTDAVASIRRSNTADNDSVATGSTTTGPATTSTTTSTTTPTTTTAPSNTVADGEVETGADPPTPLRFEGTGVHPVGIRLTVNERRVAQTATFVHVLGGDTSGGDMSIGLLMGQTVAPTVATDGTVSATDTDVEELERLADTLAAIDAVPATLGVDTEVPRGVFVQPATLQSVFDVDSELWGRLSPGLERSDIISTPRLPLEPSAAAAAGQTQRYTELLTKGEDLLAQMLPRTDIDRTVQIVRQPFSRAAADLQRKSVGARLLVMDFAQYLETEGGNGLFTDTSQLVSMALSDNATVPTAIVDPHISRRLEDGAEDPLRTSVQIVADLLVVAQSVDDEGGTASRHGMMLALSDLGVPDASVMGQLVSLLTTTEGLRLVAPKELLSNVTVLLRPGGSGEVTITLPDQAGADLTDRVDLINQISGEIFAYASMLSNGTQQVEQWGRVLDALPSTAVDDRTAAAMVAGLREQFEVYRTGIQGPAPFTFTLTGRSNTVTFSLTNTTDTELRVRVRLSSPKLTFPDGDTFQVLPPGETEINVRAEALSNGKSSVFLRVYPSADSDIQLMPEVVLTARVSSLAGLGQLLTGAFLLLLVTWWGRHWQQTRRKRIAAGYVGRHPSSNGNGNGDGDEAVSGTASGPGDELAPDAASSSLPPS